MADVGLKDLLQAGVHFGHQTHRWNPKMRKYIFAERGGIYLIDLKKTLRELNRARELVHETVREGGTVLFVCTKPQVADIVRAEAERSGSHYVTERWLGGMLTNFQTIKKNIRRLKELERGMEEGAFDFYTKKEQLLMNRERTKLDRYLSGIKDMNRLPGLVYVVDARKEEIAIREANRLGIPVVAIADTNADPDNLTVPIAGNDDAIRSVSLITKVIADEIETARTERPELSDEAKEADAYTYSTDVGESEAAGARRKRPKRRPRPELIARRRHATDVDPGEPGGDADAVQAEADDEATDALEADTPAAVAAEEAAVVSASDGEGGESDAEREDGGPA
ncbi:MAG: 30S ribosomal protein S2 [Gemmatimonadota bacterium]|nr:30S ribosomal protein S2 [Gemmatimonadota bacterium]MDH3427432.1 30S ribosomal protein S2 [Gemmatimonadota bacterium]